MSILNDDIDPDADVVEEHLARIRQLSWRRAGTVEMLVETPEPHRHAVRSRVDVVAGKGFAGDHDRKSFYRGEFVPGREVSAVSGEVLDVLDVDPVVVGDNLITRGIDLASLAEGDIVRAGEVVLQRSHREHRPCATFRRRTSPEAYEIAKQGFRGALFVVREGGALQVGDEIRIEAGEGSRTG